MKTLKRTLAFILVLTMILSLGEGIALAQSEPETVPGDGSALGQNSEEEQDNTSPEAGADGSEAPPAGDSESTVPPTVEGGEDDPEDPQAPGNEVTPEVPQDPDVSTPPEAQQDPVNSAAPETEPSTEPSAEPSAEPSETPEPTQTPQAKAEPKVWPWTEPGNSVSALMHGGTSLNSDSGFFCFEDGGLYADGALLAGVDGYDLNLVDGWLYYTVGAAVYRVPMGGGPVETVHTADAAIDQMYVMGQEIRYLSGGSLWSFDMGWTEPTTEAPAPVAEVPAPAAEVPAPVADEPAGDVPAGDEPAGGISDTIAAPAGGIVLDMGELGLEPTDTAQTETEAAPAAGPLEQLEAPEGTAKFIPTAYGNLFFTGSMFNYTLWAGMTQLYSGIQQAYTEGEWLVVVTGGETYQAAVAPLFQGSFGLQAYSLHQEDLVQNGLSDEEQLANEQAYLESDEYAAITAAEEPYYNDGIATVSTSQFLTQPLSANQQNIVLRAQQMANVQWTPQADRYAWGGNSGSYVSSKDYDEIYKNGGIFRKGATYKGVPYSQPVHGGYVGWDISLADFVNATNNAGSAFYSGYSDFTKLAPYYGGDCSSFASWCWDLPYRCTCTSMLEFSQAIENNINNIQVGDVLNDPNSHVMVVTDVAYGSRGEVVSFELTQETPPLVKVSCYGELISGKDYKSVSSQYADSAFNSFISQGYKLYRRSCNTKPNVSQPADVTGTNMIPAPTITLAAGNSSEATVTLAQSTQGAAIYYTTDNTIPTDQSTKYENPFTVSLSESKITLRAMAKAANVTSLPLTETLIGAKAPTLAVAGMTAGTGVLQEDGKCYVDNDVETLTLRSEPGATVYYTLDETKPTLDSPHGNAGEVKIDIKDKDTITIKAYAWAPHRISSAVVTFDVVKTKLHKITFDDPSGLVEVKDAQVGTMDDGVLMVKDGANVELTLDVSKVKVKLFQVDGTDKTNELQGNDETKTYKFEKVNADHTVKVVIDSGFTDVAGSDWYAEAINYCKTNGLMNGKSATVFGTAKDNKNNMIRGDLVGILCRMINPSISLLGTSFSGSTAWESSLKGKTLAKTLGDDVNVRKDPSVVNGKDNLLRDEKSNIVKLGVAGQYFQVIKTQYVNGFPWYSVYVRGLGADGKTKTFEGWVSGYYNDQAVKANTFTDLNTGTTGWASAYIQWAYLENIVNGASSTAFIPLGYITRQDICVILYNYLTKYLGVQSLDTTQRKPFDDSGSISSYAKDAVNAMINLGIISGYTNDLVRPTRTATRAEVATMIMRLDKYVKANFG